MSDIEDIAKNLPPDLQIQVRNFMVHLLEKRNHKRRSILRQDWAGTLMSARTTYTSLELQKKALEWRNE